MTHPILAATSAVAVSLKSVADVNPTFMSTADKSAALRELVILESRIAELRLRILADAGDVAEVTATRDAAEWLSVHTRGRHEDARADLTLARALDRRYPVLAAAVRAGDANLAQAREIARALDALPAEVGAELVALAESTLVSHAAEFGPRQLAQLGRRVLEVVAPEIADTAEARRLAALEAEAHRQTRLALRRVGDGTTRLSRRLPDSIATRLATYLEAFTNPRKAGPEDQPSAASPGAPLPYPRRLGRAFCQFLESVDPTRQPLHGGDATTVLITVSLEALRAELATAELLPAGEIPGEDPSHGVITAAEARRLACTAGIIPVVLGGDSEVLDFGRRRRLHSPGQRRALRLRDRVCRAEGCDIPGAWCEAHHDQPWSDGGRTDLAHSRLLCSHHHHRVHDPAHRAELLPSGDVRFHRRR